MDPQLAHTIYLRIGTHPPTQFYEKGGFCYTKNVKKYMHIINKLVLVGKLLFIIGSAIFVNSKAVYLLIPLFGGFYIFRQIINVFFKNSQP